MRNASIGGAAAGIGGGGPAAPNVPVRRINPETGRPSLVIRDEPARSSAPPRRSLPRRPAFPIAKVAARSGPSATPLDELDNRHQPAVRRPPPFLSRRSYYVVTKIHALAFEKFPGALAGAPTAMKSVGEVMAWAAPSREVPARRLCVLWRPASPASTRSRSPGLCQGDDKNGHPRGIGTPRPRQAAQWWPRRSACARPRSPIVHAHVQDRPVEFLEQIEAIIAMEARVREHGPPKGCTESAHA